MKRTALIVVGMLVAFTLQSQPTSAVETAPLNALSGTGTIGRGAILDAFSSAVRGSKWLEANEDNIRFRRDGAQSWSVTCLPVNGQPYVEEYVMTYHVYADPVVNRRSNGKVSSFTLNGWTTVQTFDNLDISQLTSCSNGDPVSRPTWRFGERGWRNYWDAPNVMPVFNYQENLLVATASGVDSAVLGAYP